MRDENGRQCAGLVSAVRAELDRRGLTQIIACLNEEYVETAINFCRAHGGKGSAEDIADWIEDDIADESE